MEQNGGQLERRRGNSTQLKYACVQDESNRLDHVRNVEIWKCMYPHMYPISEFIREKRLIWFGHVQMRYKDEATKNILHMAVARKRNRAKADMARPGDRGFGKKPDDD